MSSKTIIVTGMHRSGTSLVAHYLKECGLDLGRNLAPANVGNPLGYYEDQDFLDFHRKVLKSHKVPEFPVSLRDVQFKLNPTETEEGRRLIAAREHLHIWGWKEPRTSLFLEFWKSCLEDSCFLFLIREPIMVLDSLLRRGTDRSVNRVPLRGLQSWYVYNQIIANFMNVSRCRCMIWDIKDMTQNPNLFVESINDRFGIDLDVTTDFAHSYKASFLKRKVLSTKAKLVRWIWCSQYQECLSLYQDLLRRSIEYDSNRCLKSLSY